MKLIDLYEAAYSETLKNFEHEVERFLEIGEIVNPEYEQLKHQIDRAIEKEAEQISKTHTWGKGREIYDLDPALDDVAYAIPNSTNGVLALKNKLAKVKLKDHGLYKDTLAFYNEYKGLAEKLKELKSKVVKTSQKRAEKKEADAVELKKKFNDSSTLIKVLEQYLDEYVQKTAVIAENQFDKIMDDFASHNWDLNSIAPSPHARMSTNDYKEMERKRGFLISLTDGGTSSIRRLSNEKKQAYINSAKEDAHASYMEWVAKLIQKIGKPVKSATVKGNPWTGSILNIETIDNEAQKWHTQMIINRSKYNKLFNQFPTRRID